MKPETLPPKLISVSVELFNESGSFTFSELHSRCMAEMKKVPENCQGTIKFKIGKEEEYYSYEKTVSVTAVMYMTYLRPETNEELAARHAKWDEQARRQEDIDRQIFINLQKRFGDSCNGKKI